MLFDCSQPYRLQASAPQLSTSEDHVRCTRTCCPWHLPSQPQAGTCPPAGAPGRCPACSQTRQYCLLHQNPATETSLCPQLQKTFLEALSDLFYQQLPAPVSPVLRLPPCYIGTDICMLLLPDPCQAGECRNGVTERLNCPKPYQVAKALLPTAIWNPGTLKLISGSQLPSPPEHTFG